jgi:hypothetical protein
MSERDRLVCVHKLSDPIEANLVRGLLLNEGIPVEITGEGLVGAYSGVPKLCEVRLLVPPAYKVAAERFLRRYQDERNRPVACGDWVCPDCGEKNDPSFEICWNCSGARR